MNELLTGPPPPLSLSPYPLTVRRYSGRNDITTRRHHRDNDPASHPTLPNIGNERSKDSSCAGEILKKRDRSIEPWIKDTQLQVQSQRVASGVVQQSR